ncbi:36024_t:CDS:2, partial [Racocetra persica]
AVEILKIVYERDDNKTTLTNRLKIGSNFIPIKEYIKSNNTIEPWYFYEKCNDFNFNEGFTTFKCQHGTCPICYQEALHECCVSCKQNIEYCKCIYRCALAYPSTFSLDGSVATWAKCPFYCTKYNEETFNEHLTSCQGVITEKLKIVFLKVENVVKNVIVYTVPQTHVLMSGDVVSSNIDRD